MHLQNLFFDLDGTIINSEPGLVKAHIAALEQSGYSEGLKIIAAEGISWTIGPPLSVTAPRLINSNDPQQIRQYLETFQQLYKNIYYTEMEIYDGIPAALETLKERDYKIFICTSKPQTIAQKIIEHLGFDRFLSDLYGAYEDERPHKKEDFLHELLTRNHCRAEDSAMIGDRKFDVLAGRDLGMKVRIGVLYGFGSAEELSEHGASHLVSHPSEIIPIVTA